MTSKNIDGFVASYLENLIAGFADVDRNYVEQAARIIDDANRHDGKIIIVGNGGSAAIASHAAVDFTKAAGYRAQCFNEAGLLTCFANDFGYEAWVAKAIEYYAEPNDVVILISSSGKSPNIINGAKQTKEMGLSLITFSGFSAENALRDLGDVNFWCDSDHYNVVENSHQIWVLMLVDLLIHLRES